MTNAKPWSNNERFQRGSATKEFTITTISRDDVEMLFGDYVANSLTDAHLQRIAEEMAENYVGNHFVDDLQEAIQKFHPSRPELIQQA